MGSASPDPLTLQSARSSGEGSRVDGFDGRVGLRFGQLRVWREACVCVCVCVVLLRMCLACVPCKGEEGLGEMCNKGCMRKGRERVKA